MRVGVSYKLFPISVQKPASSRGRSSQASRLLQAYWMADDHAAGLLWVVETGGNRETRMLEGRCVDLRHTPPVAVHADSTHTRR